MQIRLSLGAVVAAVEDQRSIARKRKPLLGARAQEQASVPRDISLKVGVKVRLEAIVGATQVKATARAWAKTYVL